MPPAARVTDMHVCPMVTGIVPHVGGPIMPPGVPTVLIDFLPAATVTTMATCVGPPDIIVKGSTGVFINFLPAARLGDQTAHGGVIVMGSPTCIIGEIGSPNPGAAGVAGVCLGLTVSMGPIGLIAGRSSSTTSGASTGTITVSSPTQTPHITVIDGPKDLGCGGFDWKIWWDIPNAAGRAGWVIQELTGTFKVTGANGSSVMDKTYHYWEAWPVESGKKITRFQDKHEDPPLDDQYSSPPRAGTKGTITYVGRAQFFEGDLPADFKQNNPDTIAADLFSTTQKPAFWGTSGVTHNITSTWDCTKTPSTSSVSATAGSQTIAGTK